MIKGTGDPMVDQEAREHIVALVDLLDRFGRYIEAREEELWACTERMILLAQVNDH